MVFPADSVPPTIGKPKASAKDAKANTEWAPYAPSTPVPLRKKEQTSVDSVMKTTLVPSGENLEKRANNTTHYSATRGLKTTSPLSRKMEWERSRNNKKQERHCLGQF